ncbi:hypothetical protein SAMN05192551_10964 [Tindallia magadiensis]|uniref:Uncharacterized protein n=1 Tax=Tindallia magadiensis TaxID=69895 RepID=A0A1I3GJA2_9FIRM|nr:hypothetical protein [Tindallia magadiensis]SFI23524.1 hypothetical protein SAMN05192551_10964 [Tindallia magadiensis]
MKIEFEEQKDEIIYRVYDFDPKYEEIFQMCFYEKDDRGYTKKYPKHAKYLDRMKERYQENAPLMFDQLGYFAEVPWQLGLKKFCEMLQNSTVNWWLTGSCAACIRGVELNPHDIDIMIDSESVDEITEIFKDYLIEPIISTEGWLTKDFGVIFMDVRIDIASDPAPILDEPEPVDCGPYALKNLEIVDWNGFQIKVPPLKLQFNVNQKRGRFERAKKIKAFMEAKKK